MSKNATLCACRPLTLGCHCVGGGDRSVHNHLFAVGDVVAV